MRGVPAVVEDDIGGADGAATVDAGEGEGEGLADEAEVDKRDSGSRPPSPRTRGFPGKTGKAAAQGAESRGSASTVKPGRTSAPGAIPGP